MFSNKYILLGAFFWLVAALFIRFTGPGLFYAGSFGLLVLFVATIPAAWFFVFTCLKIFSTPTQEALVPTVNMCFIGLLLDGVAISQFPSLYGNTSEHVMLGAAWLLWGVGIILIVGLAMGKQDSTAYGLNN